MIVSGPSDVIVREPDTGRSAYQQALKESGMVNRGVNQWVERPQREARK